MQSDFDHGAYLFGTVPRNTVQTTASRRHGQYDDFYTTLQIAGMPRPNNVYVFLGDIVDRGPKQVSCATAPSKLNLCTSIVSRRTLSFFWQHSSIHIFP